jgi:phage gp46-like protein
MTDITTFWDFAGARGDWALATPGALNPVAIATEGDPDFLDTEGGLEIDIDGQAGPTNVDLVTGLDLETAVLISLFTDRSANPDDVIPDATNDPRGWWGDSGETRPIGSRLWLLQRAKRTPQTLGLAQDAITEALQWLVGDGIAATVDVVTSWIGVSGLGAQISIWQPAGPPASFNYSWVWGGLG